jgi:ribosomal protein S27AE
VSRRDTRARLCASCGAPTGRRRLCARCSPRRTTTVHVDRYAGGRTTRGSVDQGGTS